ncbi:hypothetical protein DM02DRAFT_611167 [Periconia macrospinosa]|uniref:Uncharacterized protein n=1 Tax=Periconia macrospinosa TaxID=97972 RepID=A0A2V1E561_9PLEO|nr:hypothetical protein DM02DRAFT_611167 [Periconia macrospinosa]
MARSESLEMATVSLVSNVSQFVLQFLGLIFLVYFQRVSSTRGTTRARESVVLDD